MQAVISSVEVRDTELGVMAHCVTFNKVFSFLIKAQAKTDIFISITSECGAYQISYRPQKNVTT